MYSALKKITALALILLGQSSVNAYNVKATNKLDGEVVMNVVPAGWRACGAQRKIVMPGQTASVETANCCLDYIEFTGTTGNAANKKYKLVPTRTAPNASCSNLMVEITLLANGEMIANTVR